MSATEDAALERLLADFEWRVDSSVRHQVSASRPLAVAPGHTTLVYVLGGALHASSPAAEPGTEAPLVPGDLSLYSGRSAATLLGEGAQESTVVVTKLRPAPGAERIADALPEVLTLRGLPAEEPAIAALAASMAPPQACSLSRVGDATVCGRIVTTIVSVALRSWTQHGCAPAGWLAGARDPQLGLVLEAIRNEPGRPWTVSQLASIGAMSRTVFAERFRELVGTSPVSYVTEVRMSAAKNLLGPQGRTIAEAAHLLGYESEGGFSRAFRRHAGISPSSWRRDRSRELVG